MSDSKRRTRLIVGIGCGIGFAVASTMAFLDWRLNPAGIYHSDAGTNWVFVWDTWFSWFWPVASMAAAVTLLAIWVLSLRRSPD